VLELRPLFPHLAELLAARHAELRRLPTNVVTEPGTHPAAEGRVKAAGELAEITPVPEPYRQRVRGKGYALAVNLRGLIPVVYIFGGGGLAAWGIWSLTQSSLAFGCAATAIGVPACLWGLYTGGYCLGVYENRWIERRLRQELAQRGEVLVDPQDLDGLYVSLIPRESFVKIKLTMASDVLLMKLDQRRQEILLEGDADRYRIPAGAVAVCESQCFFHPADAQHHNELWMVRLMVRVEEGLRELLLSINPTGWRPRTNARRRALAEETCRRIRRLAPCI
jgi:hypothetical protein